MDRIFKRPFLWPGALSQDRESCQLLFYLMKNPLLYPSACVGRRFSAPQIIWNRSTRRAGARGGARVGRPRWLRILMITGGSSMAAMIFKAPPQFGQCSMSMSKTRFSSLAQVPSNSDGRRRGIRSWSWMPSRPVDRCVGTCGRDRNPPGNGH
jgi:hypothetical protein